MACRRERFCAQHAKKPVYAIVAGATMREGLTMGHAGALIHGGSGTIEAKTAALRAAGARVFTRIRDIVDAISTDLRAPAG